MTKMDTLFEIITWPVVFFGTAGILLLVGLNIYFLIETIWNLRAPFGVFMGSMAVFSAVGSILLIILYLFREME